MKVPEVRSVYRIALCEDEQVFSEAQEKICRNVFTKLNIEHSIAVFDSSGSFLEAFSKGGQRYDLVLLDIEIVNISFSESYTVVRRK